MLRIVEKFKGKRISKGVQNYELNDNLTQKELLHIKVMVDSSFVEEFEEVEIDLTAKKEVETVKNKKKKTNVINNTEESN